MAQTALIVRVAQAEPRVHAVRERFHPVARLGVPAHITLLFPFMDPDHVTQDVLRKVGTALAGASAFDFSLCRIDRFPLTAYLAPEPAAPFIALTERLAQMFPEFPLFGGAFDTIVPHLTIADGDAANAERASAEMAESIRLDGPIHARCNAVELLENATGRWQVMRVFPLPDQARG
ncbi:MAG: 2'-5' RNA ligase family protein [Pseudorhodoferax sp.]